MSESRSKLGKAFCLAMPTAFLSLPFWFAIAMQLKERQLMNDQQALTAFVLAAAGTFVAAFLSAWLGFRGKSWAFLILVVLLAFMVNAMTFGLIALLTAQLGASPTSIIWPVAGVMGTIAALLATLWFLSAGRVAEDEVRGLPWMRRGWSLGYKVGFVLGGLGGVALLFATSGHEEGDLPGGGRSGAIRVIGSVGVGTLLGAVVIGYLGGLLGLTCGVFRDFGNAARPKEGSQPSRSVAAILNQFAESLYVMMTAERN